MRWWQAVTLCAVLAAGNAAMAQERFSPFIASDPVSVEQMIKLAGLRDGDRVVDLGSGDGRIVIAAARAHTGVHGLGIDLDERLVRESNAAAQALGLADRVRFVHGDVFDADLSKARVIFIWLWPEIMRMLRPKILAEAQPGTRVITGIWALGNWRPDRVDDRSMRLNLWIVPARIEGNWRWELPVGGKPRTYGAVLDQQFQDVEGVVRTGDRRGSLSEIKLVGDDLSFNLDMTLEGAGRIRHLFHGRVSGGEITGTARIVQMQADKDEEVNEGTVLPWRATRTTTSSYFDPTGAAR
jgi:SAM-dependent methyltransferase